MTVTGTAVHAAAMAMALAAWPAYAQPAVPPAPAPGSQPEAIPPGPSATAPDSRAAAAADSPATAASGMADIVVYGQRRAVGESVQRVPIAITALGPATIEATNSTSLADIGALAPGVRTASLGIVSAIPSFFIRGIGVDVSIRSIDPAVNVIQDGMVIAYGPGSIVPTFDLESVEVLRGPQGVLFGRNATGGAISLRTRRPADQLGVRFDMSYGSFNEVNANASIEGPLGTSRILGKVAVLYRSNTGIIRNTNDGIFVPAPGNPTGAPSHHPTGYVGAIDQLTIKPTFSFDVSDGTKLTLFTQYARYNDDGAVQRTIAPPAGLARTPIQTVFGFTPTTTGYSTNIDNVGYSRLRAGHAILEMTNRIGAGLLTTTAAYRKVRYDSTTNISASPFSGLFGSPYNGTFFLDNVEHNDQESLETRYNAPLFDGLELTAGLYYLRSNIRVNENRVLQSTPAPAAYQRGQFDQTTYASAAFANLDWGITPALKLSLGGRYSSDKKAITYAPVVPCPGGNLATCPQNFQSGSKRFNNFSPRAVLGWQASERTLLFASYTQGFRSGNYNSRTNDLGPGGAGPVNPEKVASYEVGVKTDLLDRRLRINLSAYRASYTDIQEIVVLPGGIINQTLVNAAKARIQGIEGEVTARPFNGVTLNANGSYIDARYTRFDVPIAGVADPTALRLPKVPKWTAYVAGTYATRVPSLDGEFSLRVSYDWRSNYVIDFLNTPGLVRAAYGLTDATLTFRKGDWSWSVFGRNLFDVYYYDTRSRALSFADVGGRPRTYGIRAVVNF